MLEQDFGGVKVDICINGCKSMWFDWQELIRLDEKKEGFGEALTHALKYPRVNDADRPPLKCPKCGVQMQTHKYKSAKEVNVDECYLCGAFFLDSGELSDIRENFMTEKERYEYCQQLLKAIPEYAEGKANIKLRTAAIKSWTHIFAKAKIK
jgi:Zn-finger nucleic acid-binding protein